MDSAPLVHLKIFVGLVFVRNNFTMPGIQESTSQTETPLEFSKFTQDK